MATRTLDSTQSDVILHSQPMKIPRPPDTRQTSPFFASSSPRTKAVSLESPIIKVDIIDQEASSHWRLTASIHNISSRPRVLSVKIYASPLFAPQQTQFVTSAYTSDEVLPNRAGHIEVDIEKRRLAEFNHRTGRWVLNDTVYVIEVVANYDSNPSKGHLSQVFVSETMVWNE